MRAFYVAAAVFTALLVLTGCPPNTNLDQRIKKSAKIPGLDEAVLAKDRTIGAAIKMSWSGDPELIQEQLAVEEVRAGKVRITGIVSRPELKERAENIARDMEGVVDVLSTITVDETLKDKRLNMDEM